MAIKGYYGDEVVDKLPPETEVDCYSVDPNGVTEYHSSGQLQDFEDEYLTDEYGFVASEGN